MARAATIRQLLAFAALTCGISWLILSPLYIPALSGLALPLPIHHALGAYGPMLAAIILSAREPGGLLALAGRFALPRRPLLAAAGALAPFIILAVAALTAFVLGQPIGSPMASSDYPGLSPLLLFGFYFVTFGIGEETGWRGYALPRLQSLVRPLPATLILSLVWALWHLPAFLYWPSFMAMGLGGAIGWLVSLVLGALILTLLFNVTGGSVLAVAVFHAAMNTAFANADPASPLVSIIGVFVSLAGLGAALVLWRQRSYPSASVPA